jgi:aldehyde dehydrogenase (NAD+)
MTAAAKHLASVTLELGGKSPVIVDETADIGLAAHRITWAKYANSGQICIAPDYVLVHESKMNAFTETVTSRIRAFFGEDPSTSDSFMRMVNARHFHRVQTMLADSVKDGAKVICGGRSIPSENYIEPTVVTDLPSHCPLMTEEIFGPIMPVIAYRSLQQAINVIRAKEKPLALYIYSKSDRNIKEILKSTSAGGVCINHNTVHFYNPHLPFGGVNNSGLGKSHGKFGFAAFSNEKAVYRQRYPTLLDRLAPPYNAMKSKLVDWVIRWL